MFQVSSIALYNGKASSYTITTKSCHKIFLMAATNSFFI